MTQKTYTVAAHGESSSIATVQLADDQLDGVRIVLDAINAAADANDDYSPTVWLWEGEPPAEGEQAWKRQPVNPMWFYARFWEPSTEGRSYPDRALVEYQNRPEGLHRQVCW